MNNIAFGPFILDETSRVLKFHSREIHLSAREYELLVLLAGSPQSVVTKDEILRALWPHQDVSEQALTQAVYRLRRILAEYDPSGSYVISIPGRGYQFAKQVRTERAVPDVDDIAFRRYRRALSCRSSTTRDALRESIKALELALQEEPYYSDALVAISEAYATAAQLFFLDPAEALDRARLYTKRALVVDPCSPEAGAMRSAILLLADRDVASASEAAAAALAFSPDSQRAQAAMVWVLLASAEFDDAIDYAKRLLRIAPSSADRTALFGIALYYSGAFESGLLQLNDALELDNANGYAQNYTVRTLCAMERYGDALHLLEQSKAVNATPYADAFSAYIAGRTARTRGGSAHAVESNGYSVLKALICVGNGDLSAAAEHLRMAERRKEPGSIFAHVDPLYDSVRRVQYSRASRTCA